MTDSDLEMMRVRGFDDEADELVRLRAKVADLQENGQRLKEIADAGLEEIKELRARIAVISLANDDLNAFIFKSEFTVDELREQAVTLRAERDNARADRDALRKDAERYRWLRDTNGDGELRPDVANRHAILEPNVISQIWYGLPENEWNLFEAAITCEPGKKMDAAIDAARSKP